MKFHFEFDEKFVLAKNCQEAVNLCQNIPLSRCTITRRTEKISKYIYNAAKNRLINCKYFSISLDESTDINNICQFLIYIKAIDANLNCFEEIFEVVSLHGHVTGQVLFDAIDSKVFSIVDKNKFNLLRGNKSNERQKCGSVRNFEQK